MSCEVAISYSDLNVFLINFVLNQTQFTDTFHSFQSGLIVESNQTGWIQPDNKIRTVTASVFYIGGSPHSLSLDLSHSQGF